MALAGACPAPACETKEPLQYCYDDCLTACTSAAAALTEHCCESANASQPSSRAPARVSARTLPDHACTARPLRHNRMGRRAHYIQSRAPRVITAWLRLSSKACSLPAGARKRARSANRQAMCLPPRQHYSERLGSLVIPVHEDACQPSTSYKQELAYGYGSCCKGTGRAIQQAVCWRKSKQMPRPGNLMFH